MTPDRTLPAKCSKCSKPLNTPLLCDYCQTLNLPPGVTDHFQFLGLPRRFDIDEGALHDRYVALSRHSHPDFHVADPSAVQALAATVSSAVNEAFRVLSDPVRRAGYLLELLGGPSSALDKSVPDSFLETMMMMREELAEAQARGSRDDLSRLFAVLRTQHDGLVHRLTGLFVELEQAVPCEATRQETLHEIRRQLNAIAYVKKMMSQM